MVPHAFLGQVDSISTTAVAHAIATAPMALPLIAPRAPARPAVARVSYDGAVALLLGQDLLVDFDPLDQAKMVPVLAHGRGGAER